MKTIESVDHGTASVQILISVYFFHTHKCAYKQAEARAEFAERSVQKLQKEVDRLEGMSVCSCVSVQARNTHLK